MASSGNNQVVKLGLWGGSGGHRWDDGSYTGIRQINLSYGDSMGSFQVIYEMNGQVVMGPNHECNDGSFQEHTINFGAEEFIVMISGCIGYAHAHTVVRSLTFTTNEKTYGPYGHEEGTYFNVPIQSGKVVGFNGSTGDIMDAIGIQLSPN